jgi:DNA-binding protein H-NS
MMRKPRDFDAELKALQDKARELKTRKVQQLGELVIATGADALTTNELAGALIMLAETKDTARKEACAKRGAAFFQCRARRIAPAAERHTGGARAQPGSALLGRHSREEARPAALSRAGLFRSSNHRGELDRPNAVKGILGLRHVERRQCDQPYWPALRN